MTTTEHEPTTPVAAQGPTPSQASSVHHRWDDPIWTWWLIPADFVAAVVSAFLGVFLVALVANSKYNQFAFYWENLRHCAFFPFTVVLGMAVAGTYRASLRSPNQSTFTMLKDFFLGISLAGLLAFFLSNVFHRFMGTHRTSSVDVVAITLVAFVLVPIVRTFIRHRALTIRPIRVLIVDSGLRKNRIATHVDIQHGFELVGWVVSSEPVPDPALGTIENLPTLVKDLQIDKVIVGSTGKIGDETASIYRQVLPDATVSIVPRSFELISWRSQLTDLSGLPLLEVAPPLHTKLDKAAKRALDIAVSVVALIVTAPLCLIFSLAIKLSSPGPLFFTQARLGRRRRAFNILKFRTMTVEDEATEAVEDDPCDFHADTPLHERRHKERIEPRITKVGRFLRRTSLDELPQFLNVLKGEMSVVGPRPFINAESEDLDGWSARRFEVRPGITGLWQVSGRNELSADELRQLDYLYVTSWSIAWDLRIMLETPSAMVRGLGAY